MRGWGGVRLGSATLGALLMLGTVSGTAFAQEAEPERIVEVSVPVQVELGEEFAITATVREADTGEPVEDAEVAFWSDGAFAGVTGEFELGTAVTNEIGVATFEHRFNVTRIHSIRAEIVGSPGSAPESVAVPVLVGGQLVSSEVGVQIPGFGGWIVPFVIGSVWAIMIVAAFWMAAVFRAGSDGEVEAGSDEDEAAAQADRLARPAFNLAAAVTGVMIVMAIGLVVILVRSPNTHSNLNPEGYDRSAVAYLDAAYLYEGIGVAESALTGNPAEDGRLIYVGNGCAGCHGLNGQGTTAARSPVTVTREWLGNVVRSGLPGGMPSFSEAEVSESDLDLIAAFFDVASRALELQRIEGSVTTGTTPPPTAPPADSATTTTAGDAVTAGGPTYTEDVAPILAANCAGCHGALGGWSAANYESVISSGDNGPVVVPGSPDVSVLAQKVSGTQTLGGPMPPGGSLADADVQVIVDWIANGAQE